MLSTDESIVEKQNLENRNIKFYDPIIRQRWRSCIL